MISFEDTKIQESYYQQFHNLSSVLNQYSSQAENKKSLDLIHNPDLLAFLKASPGITAIIDFQKEGYAFMSDNVEEMWGYKASEFLRLGLVKTITIFPLSQNEVIINHVFPLMFECFARHIEAGDIYDIRVCYNTKMIRADGSVGWYLHQLKVLHVDEENKPQFGLKLISDISDFKKDESIDMVISRKDENGIYKKIFSQNFIGDKKIFAISNREIEVLTLIGEGKSSKEIADILFISEHTVNDHRKNMIRKMEVKSTAEILKKAMAHGII